MSNIFNFERAFAVGDPEEFEDMVEAVENTVAGHIASWMTSTVAYAIVGENLWHNQSA